MSLCTYIVEDNLVILRDLSETLEEMAQVKVVGSAGAAQEAIDWLTAHSSDWRLTIIDLFLRSGTGLEVLRGCAHRSASQRAIVLTNYATLDMRRACEALGADAVFDKSTEIDELIDYCVDFNRRSAGQEAAPKPSE